VVGVPGLERDLLVAGKGRTEHNRQPNSLSHLIISLISPLSFPESHLQNPADSVNFSLDFR
jgi:hypothetical protein